MEDIFKIIYDLSKNKNVLDYRSIEKILDILVSKKNLNEYIHNINVQSVRSNGLASYSIDTKKIIVYSNTIDRLKNSIEHQIVLTDDFVKKIYINFLILRVILHEVEHANQQKMLNNYDFNSLETLIIKLSYLIVMNKNNLDVLYECSPEERFADIKSICEVSSLINYLNTKNVILDELLELEELRSFLRGYHYKNSHLEIPIIKYFSIGKKENVLNLFDLSLDNKLRERLYYGFPITVSEYCDNMEKLLMTTNKYFLNKILIKRK